MRNIETLRAQSPINFLDCYSAKNLANKTSNFFTAKDNEKETYIGVETTQKAIPVVTKSIAEIQR